MIDLEKEREAFEINWLSLGGKLDNFEYTTDQMYSLSKEASKKLSEQDKLISIMIINQSWSYWLNFARAKQAEITELKQKLSEAHASRIEFVEYMRKIESGEFVLMPRKLSENMVLHAHKYHEGEPYLPYSLYESFVEAVENNNE